MIVYYKAVRPDGTDFHTGTVDYAGICGTDQTLPALPWAPYPRCCTFDVYHASVSKADTLIGGNWPCRLFEVEGEVVAQEGNKRGFFALRVIRELPAHEALGPNGEAVAALVEQVKGLTGGLTVARYAAWSTARVAARTAAQDAAQDAGRGAARYAAWSAAGYAPCGAAWSAAGYAARTAAQDAAIALVVRGLITDEQFDVLYGPWASVMEREGA